MKICFLDLETTGFDADKDSIIEISFLVRDEDSEKKIIGKFDEVVIPEKSELTPFISYLTGISQEEIDTNPLKIETVKTQIRELIGDSVICGHNIDFDINFLVANGVDISKNERIDTHELARILLPNEESFALEILTEKYGFSHTNAHRAMSDVEASMQLYDFLLEKIKKLPAEYLAAIKPVLEKDNCPWFAKRLFLEEVGIENDDYYSEPENEESEVLEGVALPPIDFEERPNYFFRAENSVETAQFQKSITQKLPEEKFVIVSPKLDFYKNITKVPTPEVLFDRNKLEAFLAKREKLDNFETTFWLKCKLRDFLGFRGLNFFDLFSNKEKGLWQEVSCAEDSPIFAESMAKRKDEKVIAISPEAFFRFKDHEIMQDRVLIIDESEIFAEKLLFAPQKESSLQHLLEHQSDDFSVPTHFFVTRFCKEVVEKKLNHAITPFPQKLLFAGDETYPEFATDLLKISPEDDALQKMAEVLNPANLDNKTVRWLTYFPSNGNLILGHWHPDGWRDLRTDLAKKFPKKIFFHRAKLSTAFCRIFLGINNAKFSDQVISTFARKIVVPKDLKSANSPQFLDFCAEKIHSIAQEKKSLMVNFSSIETLKNTFTKLIEKSDGTHSFLGERTSGGAGKVLSLAKRKENLIFFNQKLISPILNDLPFETIILQKFPFNPPHPLLEKVDKVLKKSGQSFWDVWVIPQVAANLNRRISTFPNAKEIVMIEPRENATWGKTILRSAFPSAQIIKE